MRTSETTRGGVLLTAPVLTELHRIEWVTALQEKRTPNSKTADWPNDTAFPNSRRFCHAASCEDTPPPDPLRMSPHSDVIRGNVPVGWGRTHTFGPPTPLAKPPPPYLPPRNPSPPSPWTPRVESHRQQERAPTFPPSIFDRSSCSLFAVVAPTLGLGGLQGEPIFFRMLCPPLIYLAGMPVPAKPTRSLIRNQTQPCLPPPPFLPRGPASPPSAVASPPPPCPSCLALDVSARTFYAGSMFRSIPPMPRSLSLTQRDPLRHTCTPKESATVSPPMSLPRTIDYLPPVRLDPCQQEENQSYRTGFSRARLRCFLMPRTHDAS